MAGKTDKAANFPGQEMHKVVIGSPMKANCVLLFNAHESRSHVWFVLMCFFFCYGFIYCKK